MKNRVYKLFCAMLCVCLAATALISCSGGKVAVKYDGKGGGEINQSTMSLLIAVVNGQRNYSDLLDTPIADGQELTYGDLVVVEATTLAEMLLKCEYLNDVVYGFGLSDQEEDAIEEYIDSVVTAYGSEEALSNAMSKFGADKKALRRFVTLSLKQSVLRQNLFGEDGELYVDNEKLLDYFEEKYIIADHVYLKLTGEQKEDGTTIPLTEQEKQQKRDFANSLYDMVLSGETDFDTAIEEYGEDTYKMMYPDGYFVPKSTDTNLEENVINALIEMQEGEIRVVETETGLYILKRKTMEKELCLTVPDFAATLLYSIENEEFNGIVEAVGDVIIDKDVIAELDPAVIPAFYIGESVQ